MNKVRPGVYVNVTGSKPLAHEIGARGVVVMPLSLSWGMEHNFTSIGSLEELTARLSFPANDTEVIAVKETLKNASKVLVYRVNGGTKAKATINDELVAEALYGGSRGKDISVTITGTGPYIVRTHLNGKEIDVQQIMVATEFVPNSLIRLAGTGNLTAVTVNLTGGTETVASQEDYEGFLDACKLVDYQVISYTGTDNSIKGMCADFVKQQRELGTMIQCVFAAETNVYNSESVIAVKNGVYLSDGTLLSASIASAWVAGATAGASVSESNTFKQYVDAVDITGKLTNMQVEDAINNGLFVFTSRRNRVVAEYDINTLVSYSTEKPKDFRKNKVIRVLDTVRQDIVSIYEGNYVGKIQNNQAGRNLLKGSLVEYLEMLVVQGAIESFEPADILITQGSEKDTVVIRCAVIPTDTVDKIYVTVEVK